MGRNFGEKIEKKRKNEIKRGIKRRKNDKKNYVRNTT